MKKSKIQQNVMKNEISTTNYIEICGVIASGKSTIANILAEIGYIAVLEKFDINPFLQQFYENPEDHTFETELAFLILHYNQIKNAQKLNNSFVCDFSLLLDLVFADVTLTERERKVFMAVYNEVSSQVYPPKALIHITCDPAIPIKRIQKRCRDIEKSVTIDYLKKLENALEKRIGTLENKVKVITIDSEKYDFAHNVSDRNYIKKLLEKNVL